MNADTRYNPLPQRVTVPLYPYPLPGRALVGELMRGLRNPEEATEGARAAVAELLGVAPDDVVLTESGMAALIVALRALRGGHRDEVIVPTFACPRMIDAVIAAEMTPVLCDVDESGNPQPEDVKKRLTIRTRAVIVGHTFGVAADIAGIRALCDEEGVALIDDAAQAFGMSVAGRPLGTWGSLGILSFGRHKPIHAGGGGAVVRVTGPAVPPLGRAAENFLEAVGSVVRGHLIDGARRISSGLPRRLGLQPPPVSDVAQVIEAGSSRAKPDRSMPWVWASVLADQLKRIEVYRTRQRQYQALYRSAVSECPELFALPGFDRDHVNFFAVGCVPHRRHAIASHLARHGVESTWLYYPLHRVRRFAPAVRGPGFPGAEKLWPSVLCLPCRGWHSRRQIDRALAAVRSLPGGGG